MCIYKTDIISIQKKCSIHQLMMVSKENFNLLILIFLVLAAEKYVKADLENNNTIGLAYTQISDETHNGKPHETG